MSSDGRIKSAKVEKDIFHIDDEKILEISPVDTWSRASRPLLAGSVLYSRSLID